MNTLRLAVCGLICLGAMALSLRAESLPVVVPGLVDLGFNDFRGSGYAKAFSTWAYGGPLEQDTAWAKRLGATASFWNSLGRFLSYNDVDVRAISGRSIVVRLSAQFDRGEVFFRFIVYQEAGRSTVTSVKWSTDPACVELLRVQ